MSQSELEDPDLASSQSHDLGDKSGVVFRIDSSSDDEEQGVNQELESCFPQILEGQQLEFKQKTKKSSR